jgi:hypothetical protein
MTPSILRQRDKTKRADRSSILGSDAAYSACRPCRASGVRPGVEIEPDAGRKSERIETNGQAAREGKRLGLKPVGTNCSNFKDASILTAPVKNANSIFAK